ncbi:MAG: hypothetical protein ACR2LR_21930 [Hassallia sp.]
MVVAILNTFYRLQPLIGFGNYSRSGGGEGAGGQGDKGTRGQGDKGTREKYFFFLALCPLPFALSPSSKSPLPLLKLPDAHFF